uniref:HMA domain-containing protein n=1 Tax=Oryza glumipatula TaxID=40148 RepID=A0A0D9ZLY4_9ORYZ
MKQKIVIKVCAPCHGCRAKALEVAARAADGVISLAITGDDRDKLEVVGVGVDVTRLVICLRKKVCYAEILLVEEVKEEKKEEEEKKEPECKPCYWPPYCYAPPPVVVYDEPSACSIM